MNFSSDDDLVKEFARRGVRASTAATWTRQSALDTVRENRRRYAGNPRGVRYAAASSWLLDGMTAVCDVPPAEMASVLITTSALLGTFDLLNDGRVTAADLSQILAFAADDLDREANGGESP